MAHVSQNKYEMAVQAKNRALARAREIKGGAGGYRSAAGTLGGSAAAAVIDAKMGTATNKNPSMYAGVGAAVAGVALGMPDLVNAGTGMLAPALYSFVYSKAGGV